MSIFSFIKKLFPEKPVKRGRGQHKWDNQYVRNDKYKSIRHYRVFTKASYEEIAEKFGITKSMARYIVVTDPKYVPHPHINTHKPKSTHAIRLSIVARNKVKRLSRVASMLEMYLVHNKTLDEIGQEFNVTRQCVEQTLARYECYTEERKLRKAIKHVFPYECKNCGKPGIGYKNRKYCSKACSSKHIFKDYMPKHGKPGSPEYLAFMNEKQKSYYHRVLKHRPDFKARVKTYNDRQYHRKHGGKPRPVYNRDKVREVIAELQPS